MKRPGPPAWAEAPVRRYLDPDCGCIATKLLPGQFHVTGGEALVTVLGSCVAACIRDRVTGVGGMNHFMLPVGADRPDAPPSAATRYGNHAMERLINEILRLGGRRANLEAKVFGGARVLAIKSDIGRRNGDFVQAYLHLEGLPLVARDLGGIHPRKVIFFPKEGLVRVRRLTAGQEPGIFAQERDYSQNLATQPVGGPIEIF
ncbi:MAG: chemoreceptor glutamine deamidase CheD [Chromatiaceae bacterium]|nr:chemoreceptor glutamine deamidase CheD [Chromatiaceae bacterium]